MGKRRKKTEMGINTQDLEIKNPVIFREVQRFSQVWIWALVLLVAGIAWFGFIRQIIFKQQFGNNPAPDSVMIIIWILFGMGLPAFFHSLKLITEVRENGLYIKFFLLHRRFQKFDFHNLNSYEVTTYSPLKEYGGWGIRYGTKGKAYNVKGNKGLLLNLKNGSNTLIGSQKPELLFEALEKVFHK
jgi:hypothetical protein